MLALLHFPIPKTMKEEGSVQILEDSEDMITLSALALLFFLDSFGTRNVNRSGVFLSVDLILNPMCVALFPILSLALSY